MIDDVINQSCDDVIIGPRGRDVPATGAEVADHVAAAVGQGRVTRDELMAVAAESGAREAVPWCFVATSASIAGQASYTFVAGGHPHASYLGPPGPD